MIANYTNHAADERAGACWVRRFSTALHRSKRRANRLAHAGRLCHARPPAAFRGLSNTIPASFIVQQHRAVLKQRERTISLNGGWFLHLREEANPCRLRDPFRVRATISHDLM